MFCVVWDYLSSKLKDKQYKQKNSPKITKLKSKISLILGLASLGFDQPRPGGQNFTWDWTEKYPIITSLSNQRYLSNLHRTTSFFHVVPRVFVSYCANLTNRATLASSVTGSILTGLKNDGNERKENINDPTEPRVCQKDMCKILGTRLVESKTSLKQNT